MCHALGMAMRIEWRALTIGLLLAGCGGEVDEGPWRPDGRGPAATTSDAKKTTTLLPMGGPALAATELVVRGEAVFAAVLDGERLDRVVELDAAAPGAVRTVRGGYGEHVGVWVGGDRRIFELSASGLVELRDTQAYTTPVWSTEYPRAPVAITSASGQALVGDSGGRLHVLDPRTGAARSFDSGAGRPLGLLDLGGGDLAVVTGSSACEEIGAIQIGTVELGSATGSMRDLRKLGLTRCPTGHVAADAATLYWTQGDGTVWKVERAGGAPSRLAADQEAPIGIAVDETYVYWTELGHYESSGDTFVLRGGSIKRAKKVDGSIERIPLEGIAPFAVAVTPTRLVWSSGRGGGVFSMPR